MQRDPLVKAAGPSKALPLHAVQAYLVERSERVRTPKPGVWHLSVDGVLVLLIARPEEVRIMAPIFSLAQLDSAPKVQRALLMRLLEANFEASDEVRYAVFDEMVFASVTHRRESLRVEDLGRVLDQIVNLHKNTFRSGDRGYSARTPDPDSTEVDPRRDERLAPKRGAKVPRPVAKAPSLTFL